MKSVKILDVGIEPNLGSLKGLLFHYLFDKVDVAVINVSVGDDVNKFAGLKAGHLSQHMGQSAVLTNVPVVCRQHVLRALIEYCVELVSRDIKGHAVCAGVEMHFVQIGMIVDVGHNSAGTGVVFKVVNHPIHLVEILFGIFVLYAELIAVGLFLSTRFHRPRNPKYDC